MKKTLALLHTIVWISKEIQDICLEVMPEVETYNIVDEGLLRQAMEAGRLTPSIYKRVGDHALGAQAAGADALLVTCSSISPCVDVAQRLVDIPVLKIDEAMADKAVQTGERIGVIATSLATLPPTTELLRERARLKGKKISIQSVLCREAFEAMGEGDVETHDQIVERELLELMKRADVVVLAQASMARLVESMAEDDMKVPILSSPRLGIERARQVLEGLKS